MTLYNMKVIAYISFILLILLTACEDNTEKNINSETYPESDAVYVKMVKEYVLYEDGDIEYNYYHKLKLLTHFAFNHKYGETFIEYNPLHQNIEINDSYTIMADGKKINTPDNAFNEVLPRSASGSPAFNMLREMVITHTALEVNSNIVLDYSLSSDESYFPFLIGDEVLNAESPIKDLEIRVIVPEGMKLNYRLLNDTANVNISDKAGSKTYTWHFENLPAKYSESFHEDIHKLYPTLIFSTAKDYDEIHDYFLNQMAFSYNFSNDIIDEIHSKINIWHGKDEHMLNIWNFIVDDFKYFPVSEKYTGFKLNTVQDIWNNSGGNKLEKTLLLSTALNEAGILAQPVAVACPKLFDDTCGNPLLFEDYLIKTGYEHNKDIYISAIEKESQSELYNLNGKLIIPLDINDNTKYEIKLENSIQRADFVGKLKLTNKSEISGSVIANLHGSLNPFLMLLENPTKAYKILNNVKSAKIEELTMGKSLINLEIKDKLDDEQSGYLFYSFAEYNKGIASFHIPNLPEKRLTAFKINFPFSENYSYTLELPDKLELINTNFSKTISNEIGEVIIKIEKRDNLLLFERSITIPKDIIQVDKYKDFRALIKLWNNPKYKELIFKEL